LLYKNPDNEHPLNIVHVNNFSVVGPYSEHAITPELCQFSMNCNSEIVNMSIWLRWT